MSRPNYEINLLVGSDKLDGITANAFKSKIHYEDTTSFYKRIYFLLNQLNSHPNIVAERYNENNIVIMSVVQLKEYEKDSDVIEEAVKGFKEDLTPVDKVKLDLNRKWDRHILAVLVDRALEKILRQNNFQVHGIPGNRYAYQYYVSSNNKDELGTKDVSVYRGFWFRAHVTADGAVLLQLDPRYFLKFNYTIWDMIKKEIEKGISLKRVAKKFKNLDVVDDCPIDDCLAKVNPREKCRLNIRSPGLTSGKILRIDFEKTVNDTLDSLGGKSVIDYHRGCDKILSHIEKEQPIVEVELQGGSKPYSYPPSRLRLKPTFDAIRNNEKGSDVRILGEFLRPTAKKRWVLTKYYAQQIGTIRLNNKSITFQPNLTKVD